MTRSRRQTIRSHHPASSPPRPTAVPPAELLDCAAELRSLLDELADLTAYGDSWGMRVLRRNVELALLSPDTLGSADNQLDFIEELTEAAWDGADGGFRHARTPRDAPDEMVMREQRRRAVVARLDDLAHQLCAAAEAWRDQVVATAETAPGVVTNPQEDHSS